ncbi:lysophospholipid acyltransferase family protein [Ectobacillus panaciterrae]|uniref:lysophospholipid acyltransferase family protein n=1 Tax=Ectobacillus panaciterrae TaxID=363872 RepID=UPI00048A8750
MLRLIYIGVYFLGWFVVHIPYIHTVKKKANKEKMLNEKLQKLVRKLLKLMGIQLNVTGKENIPDHEQVLFIANHESHLDPIVLYACLNRVPYFVMKEEIRNIPIFRTWIKEIGHIYLKRGDRRSAVEVLQQMKKYLQEGKDVFIFPEGTITEGEKELPFKPGSFRSAVDTETSVVPITIKGTARLFEQQRYTLKSGTVEVIIHPKVETIKGKWEHTQQLAVYVEKIVKDSL